MVEDQQDVCSLLRHWSPSQVSPFTLVPSSVGPAPDAGSSPLVALGSVSVTLAGTAVGEAPVAWPAAVTALPKRPCVARALAGVPVTQSARRPFQAAAAGWTDAGRKEGKPLR